MRKLISFFLVALLAITSLTDCAGKGDDTSKSDLLGLILTASSRRTDPDFALCSTVVATMNQCIGSNNGYSYTYMCSSAKIQAVKDSLLSTTAALDKAGGVAQTATTTTSSTGVVTVTPVTSSAVWSAILSCVSAKVASSYCNLDQNKVMDARTADGLAPGFGPACDAFAGSTRLNVIDSSVRSAPGK
ncbi:MAG: hypothetical protein SFU98_18300 [Leptospiraceae bacterium]|nr:hypothetical protein [Leptospiraceae bacterium]